MELQPSAFHHSPKAREVAHNAVDGARMANSSRASRRLPIDCVACRASVEGLCQDCAPEVRRVIASYKSSDCLVKAGDDLFRPGESCSALYLVDGWMVLYNGIGDGRRQILHFALPGALLGLFPGRVAIHGGEALTDVTAWLVPHDNLAPLIEAHPGVGLRLAWIVWRERNLAYDHLATIGRRPARERVARSLLELFVRYRMHWPAHRTEEMYLPLTQKHIGDATGLTGAHVNRILRGLRNDGILEFHDRRLRILDPDKLLNVAQVDPQTILSWTGRFPSA